MEGVARLNFYNGTIYEGEFMNDLKHGSGREIHKKG